VYLEINVCGCGPPFLSVRQVATWGTVSYSSSLSKRLVSSWRLFLTIGNSCLQFLIPAHYVKIFQSLIDFYSEKWPVDTLPSSMWLCSILWREKSLKTVPKKHNELIFLTLIHRVFNVTYHILEMVLAVTCSVLRHAWCPGNRLLNTLPSSFLEIAVRCACDILKFYPVCGLLL